MGFQIKTNSTVFSNICSDKQQRTHRSFALQTFVHVLQRKGTRVVILIMVSKTWWRHQMVTFSALVALCAGNSPVTDEFPAQRPVTRRFDVFFDLRLDKQESKHSWSWWFETLSRLLWRHSNDIWGSLYFASHFELKHQPKANIGANYSTGK